MKGFIELQSDGTTFTVALATIAAITEANEDGCVITFTQPIPPINSDSTVYIGIPYHQVLDKLSDAQ